MIEYRDKVILTHEEHEELKYEIVFQKTTAKLFHEENKTLKTKLYRAIERLDNIEEILSQEHETPLEVIHNIHKALGGASIAQ